MYGGAAASEQKEHSISTGNRSSKRESGGTDAPRPMMAMIVIHCVKIMYVQVRRERPQVRQHHPAPRARAPDVCRPRPNAQHHRVRFLRL